MFRRLVVATDLSPASERVVDCVAGWGALGLQRVTLAHVHAVRTVEEGLALLTGLPAGAPGEPGTALGIVDAALLDMARKLKDFGEKSKRENGKASSSDEAPNPELPPPPTPDPKLADGSGFRPGPFSGATE
jgi:nucleotide-binding universal stress UspA family protein